MKVIQVSYKPGFGGPGIYLDNLTQELSDTGVDIVWLYNGIYDARLFPYLKTEKINANLKKISLVNSPNQHSGKALPFTNSDISNTKIEKLFQKVLESENPDIVHFHDLGGFCSSLLKIAYNFGCVVLNSHHNYYFICPKNDLINQNMQICTGPENGKNCVKCVKYSLFKSLKGRSVSIYESYVKNTSIINKILSLLKFKNLSKKEPRRNILTNDQINQSSVKLWNKREQINLNICSNYTTLNIAVSKFVYDYFIKWGIPKNKILLQHIGTRAAEFLKPNKRIPSQCIKFGFIGAVVPIKGVHTLIEAYNKLDSNLNTKLIIYGNGETNYVSSLRKMVTKNTVEFRGKYTYSDLPRIFEELDIVIIPPIWYDNAPQTVFESLSAGKVVIASNIGGIPDFVIDGENGFLFEAGNANDLALKMNAMISDTKLFDKFYNNLKSMKSIQAHAKELKKLYSSLCIH